MPAVNVWHVERNVATCNKLLTLCACFSIVLPGFVAWVGLWGGGPGTSDSVAGVVVRYPYLY
jgi:hypothetical protein